MNIPDSDERIVALSGQHVPMRMLFKIKYSSTRTDYLSINTASAITTNKNGPEEQEWQPAGDVKLVSSLPVQGQGGTGQFSVTFAGNKTEFTDGSFHGIGIEVHVTMKKSNGRFTKTLNLYGGRCTNFRLTKEAGEIVTVVEFADELSRIDSSRVMILTDSEQRRRSANDDILKYIHESDRNLRWGRE